MDEEIEFEDLNWLVDSRSDVQTLLLALWTIAKEHPQLPPRRQLQLHLLVATCFALWRAAFLAHGKRSSAEIHADARKFLEALVLDNAITYAQDQRSKAWTFGYYMNDAYFRLEYYHRTFDPLGAENAERVSAYLASQSTGSESDAHVAWKHAFNAALSAAESLAKSI